MPNTDIIQQSNELLQYLQTTYPVPSHIKFRVDYIECEQVKKGSTAVGNCAYAAFANIMQINIATKHDCRYVLHTVAHEYYHAIQFSKEIWKGHSEEACDAFAEAVLEDYLKGAQK